MSDTDRADFQERTAALWLELVAEIQAED